MQPVYYEFAISWFAGWAAGIFWYGMEIDVPKPGGGGDPLPWGRLLLGAIGGGAAVLFAIVADVRASPLVAIGVALVAGSFAATVAAPFVRTAKRTS